MKPDSTQPARLYGADKTNKFENLEEIAAANLKFRPIIDQLGTFTDNTAKVISDYLKPLCKLNIPSMIHKKFHTCYLQLHLYKMTRKVYHEVESLFTNVPIEETISYYY